MNKDINFSSFMRKRPDAIANLAGSSDYPDIRGTVTFRQTNFGVIVTAQVSGLPKNNNVCLQPIFAFHIHSGNKCSGNENDYFADALMHYNPNDCPHPYHAGDMPPLFGAGGIAFSAFLSNRFKVQEIIGRTVIIHSKPDDFKSQPSGGAGTKIACGVIRAY